MSGYVADSVGDSLIMGRGRKWVSVVLAAGVYLSYAWLAGWWNYDQGEHL
jgi:hypothetical protein